MEKKQIYHEKQKLQFCLMHALNNLFQEQNVFTRADLNTIADKLVLQDPITNQHRNWNPLSPIFKPHHNSLTGNYDINVLIAALEGKGKKVVWHDRRTGVSSIDLNGSQNELMGIVINVPIRKFGGFWRSRHWVALRKVEEVWYNLDSDFVAPYAFKDTDELKEFLDYIITLGAELMELKKKLRRGYRLNNFVALVLVVISISCLLVMLVSVLRLPEVLEEDKRMGLYRILNIRKMTKENIKLGELGEMMVGMLPVDLAFTIFVPSEKAFRRDLKLWFNESSKGTEENDNTYATLSRILGFSVVPQHLRSVDVLVGKEIVLDSISGFKLYVSRGLEGSVVVNRVRSKVVDLKKGEIVIHIMDGVIMDAEFEQSFQSDYEAEN